MQSVKGALAELGEKYPERKIAEIISERMKGIGTTGGWDDSSADSVSTGEYMSEVPQA